MDYNLFKGLVTHVLDPSNFWMRIGTDYDMHFFGEYQKKLDAFYNADVLKYRCNIDQLHSGYLVVVVEPLRNDIFHWERAQVTRVDSENETVDVFFVDLGYTSIVHVDNCRAITAELFHFLPPQASRVSLGGVKPLANSWTSRATNLLQRETADQEVLTLIIHYEEASACCTVVIYTKQDDNTWKSLIHEMQHQELAVSTGGVIQETLSEDVVNECLKKMEEKHKQDRDSEETGGAENETETSSLVGEEEDKTEKWTDELGGSSQDFLASITASEDGQYQESSSEDKERVVTGFDYRVLMQTRTISLSQMQKEKGWETQEATKSCIERDLERMDSDPTNPDDQDWDAVQDTVGYHTDIVSQIYHGVPDRQYSSDDGMSDLWDRIKMPDMRSPTKPPPLPTAVTATQPLNLENFGPSYPSNQSYVKGLREEEGVGNTSKNYTSDFGDADGKLSEMESYRLEKQIKEILVNPNNLESDVICASVYGVVEPELDAPVDHLRVVICAILEHIMENGCQQLEVALAILDTYSDATEFGQTMIEVIEELKKRFVKLHTSERLGNRHKEFALVLAFTFKQAEDWESHVCKSVQDHVVTLLERWIIFNKQRQQSGEDVVITECVYLETANTFLTESCEFLEVKYKSVLTEVVDDIRFKLLHDATTRSIRTILLDMLLTLASGRKHMCSVGTQTDYQEDETKCKLTSDINGRGDCIPKTPCLVQGSSTTDLPFPESPSSHSFSNSKLPEAIDDISSLRNRKDIPKAIRKLSPRLFKKCLQDNNKIKAPVLPMESHDTTTINYNNNLTNRYDEKSQNVQINSESVPISKQFTSQSPSDEIVSTSQSTSSYVDEYGNNTIRFATLNDRNENIEPKYGNAKLAPSLELESTPASYQIDKIDKEAGNHKVENVVTNLPVPSASEFHDDGDYSFKAVNNKWPDETITKDLELEDMKRKSNIKAFNKQSVNITVEIQKDTTIRYTPKQLRDLNPFQGQPELPLWDLWEPKEVLEKMIVMVHPGRPHSEEEDSGLRTRNYSSGKLVKSKLNPSAEEFNWRSTCYSNGNRPSDNTNKNKFGSSVDPDLATIKATETLGGRQDYKKEPVGNFFVDGHKVSFANKNDNNSLQRIASDLFKSPDDLLKHDLSASSLNKTTDSSATEFDEDSSMNNGEMWHEDSIGTSQGGEFLKPKKQTNTESRRTKKKKGRGKPLDEFLQEQDTLKKLSNDFDEGMGYDGDNDDLFSAEALQMYEELEHSGVGVDLDNDSIVKDAAAAGATVLMPSKIGSHIASSSKRPSLFSSLRLENQQSEQKVSKPWVPASRRFCTRCGSGDHVVYDCNEHSSRTLH